MLAIALAASLDDVVWDLTIETVLDDFYTDFDLGPGSKVDPGELAAFVRDTLPDRVARDVRPLIKVAVRMVDWTAIAELASADLAERFASDADL